GAPEQPAHTPGSHVPTSDWNASQSADYQVRTAPTTPVLPQRGWLPDPSEIHLERMWDGDRWTARTRDRVTKVEHPSPGLYDYRPGEWVAQPQPRKRGVKAWGIVGLSVLFVLTVVVVFQGLDRLGES